MTGAGFYSSLADDKVYNNCSLKFHTVSSNGSCPRGHGRTKRCLRGGGWASKNPSRMSFRGNILSWFSETLSPGFLSCWLPQSPQVCFLSVPVMGGHCSQSGPCSFLASPFRRKKKSALMARADCSPSPGELWRNWLALHHLLIY